MSCTQTIYFSRENDFVKNKFCLSVNLSFAFIVGHTTDVKKERKNRNQKSKLWSANNYSEHLIRENIFLIECRMFLITHVKH